MATITIHNTSLRLLPDKACWWPDRKMLLVADTHFGKASVFRREGIALPQGNDEHDIGRLSRLIDTYKPKQLVILGDFFHGKLREDDPFFTLFKQWRERYQQLVVTVVAGNHDRYFTGTLSATEWLEQLEQPPFILTHEPYEPPTQRARFVLAGHIHPTYVLDSRADRLRLPIFWFSQSVGILPSFGSMTGGYNVKPKKPDRIFVAGTDEVVEINR